MTKKQSKFPSKPRAKRVARQQKRATSKLAPATESSEVASLQAQALSFHRARRLGEAEQLYRRILRVQPQHFDSLHLLGVIHYQRGQHIEAVQQIDLALKVNPNATAALNNRSVVLNELKQFDDALASSDKAIALKPDSAEAFHNRGNALHKLKRLDEALASYDMALALKPDHVEAFNNRGVVLRELNRLDEALASYDKALALKPDYAEVFNNRGNALQELNRFDEALASYDEAIALKPDHVEAFNNRGVVLRKLNRLDQALATYDKALALKPDYAEVFNNRGNALQELNRFDEALANYDKAIALKPDYAEAFHDRANALKKLNRLDEALASYDRALAAKSDHVYAFSGAADCSIRLCDWDRRTRVGADLEAHVSGKNSAISPFVLLGYSGEPGLQLQCARNYIEKEVPLLPRPFWTGETWRHDELRVAYLSADFRSHAMAYLTAELFERHDRALFKIIGVSFGVDDSSEMRKRLVAAFDRFYDVRRKSDEEVAKLLYDLQVDIAIDLMGYTADSRPRIFTYRAAPIQASYIGYPGTMGAEFIDYIITDKIVAPFEHQRFYTERIVHLPDCYLPYDTKRKISERTPPRHDFGLPERGFVFCCFNNNWKIAPEVFDIWMRLLGQIEGSVLWLLRGNESAEKNLRREAQARGIDSSRLVFAGRLPMQEHLARYRLADLFLDTLPYNAHTTASDALWVGLPVLTCKGEAFAGRVAASLLHAVGVPELITSDLEEYQAVALQLARDSAILAEIKTKLASNRNSSPLFNIARFTRHIEAAYAKMWEIWQRGEVPKSFGVEPI